MRAISLLAATGLMTGCCFAADPHGFSCTWDLGPNGEPGASLYANVPLRFEVNFQRKAMRPFDGTDSVFLGEVSGFLLTDTSFKLEFFNTKLDDAKTKYRITIWIDRFDLKTTLTLQEGHALYPQPPYSIRWLRIGSCAHRTF